MPYTPPVGTADLAITGSYTPSTGTANLALGASQTPYTQPVGIVDLALEGSYTPPIGTVPLPIGGVFGSAGRTATIAGQTAVPTGLVIASRARMAMLSGVTAVPTGALVVKPVVVATLVGATSAPGGFVAVAVDPNLLSAVHQVLAGNWRDGDHRTQGAREPLREATPTAMGGPIRWQEGMSLPGTVRVVWQPSQGIVGGLVPVWQNAARTNHTQESFWNSSPRLTVGGVEVWQDALRTLAQTDSPFAVGVTRALLDRTAVWQQGAVQTQHVRSRMQDGLRLLAVEIVVWQPGGYPGNAPNPGSPVPPPPIPLPWGTTLRLGCPLPGTTLRIGRTPCVLIAEREIPSQRSYMVLNSASLVRWPDLTPLPCAALTVETDFDSWCWGLTATLSGPDAWALVQPNPLACEVQATINGQVWRFLLDVPNRSRSFNSDRVSLKGRSRSAWLADPYAVTRDLTELDARDMVQLAEAALENTGWTIAWDSPNWVVPAGRYVARNTPMGALMRLVSATDDGLTTDPWQQVLYSRRRWPVASWLVDGETVDLLVPESAILSLTQSPVYTQPLNGVYVSGTSHGALALVKIAGTDGGLQPDAPITDDLLCDTAGVAARQRGLNALSDAGAGFTMDAELLFAPAASPAFPLIPPGQIVSIAGMKGVSRSCKVAASWSGGALQVRQSVGLERREVEA